MSVIAREPVRPLRLLGWLLLVLSAGCFGRPVVSVPNGPQATQPSGDVATPAAVADETTTITIAAPAPIVKPAPPISPTNAAPPTGATPAPPLVTIVTHRASATAATTHAPPSPTDIAKAAGVRGAYWFAFAGVLTAGLLLWLKHPLAALFVAAGALSLPVLARHDVAAALIAAGLALVAAWYLLKFRGHPLAEEVTSRS